MKMKEYTSIQGGKFEKKLQYSILFQTKLCLRKEWLKKNERKAKENS